MTADIYDQLEDDYVRASLALARPMGVVNMPDAMDHMQALNDVHVENALQHHANRPKRAGLAECENIECGDDISPDRQAMGARLCVACQTAEEAQGAHFRQWWRR